MRISISKGEAAALTGLIIIVILFQWRLLFTDLILPRGDPFNYFYPYWQYRHEMLRAGQLPLWNPYLFMGAPLLANSQAGVLYPPNWLLTPFDAPLAVKLSLVGHSLLAALGTYVLCRQTLRLHPFSSLIGGVIFALGGYFGAQLEHVNQAQGLAWLPWIAWLWHASLGGRPVYVLLLGLAFGMQLLAGHTQSAFITGVALSALAAWHSAHHLMQRPIAWANALWPVSALALGAGLGLGWAAPQVLPTLELTGLSGRAGGLSALEAVSFSLRPALMGRALLPGYGPVPLFSEYVAYVGLAGLVLAVFGLAQMRRTQPTVTGFGILAGLGVFLALGAYNPLYWFLVNLVPGFDLFRAPARWLVLTALGLACLAAQGFEAAQTGARTRPLIFAVAAALPTALIGASWLAALEAAEVPGAASPTQVEIILWLVMLAASWGLLLWMRYTEGNAWAVPALGSVVVIELLLGASNLPYNMLSIPEAWSGHRPALDTLTALQQGEAPGRVLSMSQTLFDPGDIRELRAVHGRYLGQQALDDYINAVKQKEIIAPNLPLAWRIPSADGYDGGLLPTASYASFTEPILQPGTSAADGRLREYLNGVPPGVWLRKMGISYVITDKVLDAWVSGVYYDLQFPQRLSAGSPFTAVPDQSFNATGIGLVGRIEGAGPDQNIGQVRFFSRDGDEQRIDLIAAPALTTPQQAYQAHVISWQVPQEVIGLQIEIDPRFGGSFTLQGATVIDERTGAFQPINLAFNDGLRLIYSADVKIYEVGGVQRAYLTCAPVFVASQQEAFQAQAQNPSLIPIEAEAGPQPDCDDQPAGDVSITAYEPEQITLQVENAKAGVYLVLSDAFYPGWQASIDGRPVEIVRANGLFRAVEVPAGSSQVIFSYSSQPLQTGAWITLGTAVLSVAGAYFMRRRPTPLTP